MVTAVWLIVERFVGSRFYRLGKVSTKGRDTVPQKQCCGEIWCSTKTPDSKPKLHLAENPDVCFQFNYSILLMSPNATSKMCNPWSGWAQLQRAPYSEMWKMRPFKVQLWLQLSWEEHWAPSTVLWALLCSLTMGAAVQPSVPSNGYFLKKQMMSSCAAMEDVTVIPLFLFHPCWVQFVRADALRQRMEQETWMPQGRGPAGSRSWQEVTELGAVEREGTCRSCWTVNQSPSASQPRLVRMACDFLFFFKLIFIPEYKAWWQTLACSASAGGVCLWATVYHQGSGSWAPVTGSGSKT